MYRYFKRTAGVGSGNHIHFWKSRGLSNEKFGSITASNYKITPELSFYGTETKVQFNESCLKQDKVTYNHGKIVNIYSNYSIRSYPTLENCLFGAVTLTKNTDIDKYKYSGYGIGFDRHGEFSFGNGLIILSFFNSYLEKPEVIKLNNVQLLKELPFYDEVSIVKNKTAFSRYARSYKIEIVDKRDVIVQSKSSEISIKELFKDLLIELKGFKYQITLAAFLSKMKNSGKVEYSPVYLNSLTKTVINSNKFNLVQAFQEIIHRLENWISHGSGWIVEEIISQFLNVSSYLPLSGSTYIKLPVELNHPMKGLINIKNNDNKCFLWCHVRHLNLDCVKPNRITKKDKEIAKGLIYSSVNFPVSKKDYDKISVLNKININVFVMKIKLFSLFIYLISVLMIF